MLRIGPMVLRSGRGAGNPTRTHISASSPPYVGSVAPRCRLRTRRAEAAGCGDRSRRSSRTTDVAWGPRLLDQCGSGRWMVRDIPTAASRALARTRRAYSGLTRRSEERPVCCRRSASLSDRIRRSPLTRSHESASRSTMWGVVSLHVLESERGRRLPMAKPGCASPPDGRPAPRNGHRPRRQQASRRNNRRRRRTPSSRSSSTRPLPVFGWHVEYAARRLMPSARSTRLGPIGRRHEVGGEDLILSAG